MAKKNKYDACIIEKEESFFHEFLEMGFIVMVALSIAIIFGTYVTMSRGVAGISMRPTYNNTAQYTDYNATYDTVRITRIGAVKRGNVIVFVAPKKNNRLLIKRVIAVGGDTLEFRRADGGGYAEVWLNDKKLDEPYINKLNGIPLFTNLGQYRYGQAITVPKNCYFVMGDNRDKSDDSRFSDVGFVPKKDVDGKVYLYVPKGDTFISALWHEIFS